MEVPADESRIGGKNAGRSREEGYLLDAELPSCEDSVRPGLLAPRKIKTD